MNSKIFKALALFIVFGLSVSSVASASLKGKRSRSIEDLAALQKKSQRENEVKVAQVAAKDPLGTIHQTLLRAFSGKEVDSVLVLGFLGQRIPLQTKLLGQKLDLWVQGANSASGHSCFELSVDFLQRTGWVKGIYSSNGNCPFLGKRHGTVLLEFVDRLSQVFALKEVGLFDQSEIRDEKTGQTINLRFLRTLLKGEGWYESHGYVPVDYEAYRAAVERFRNFSLAQLRARLCSLQNEDWYELRANYLADHWAEFLGTYGEQFDAVIELHNEYFKKIKSRLDLINAKLAQFAETIPVTAESDRLHSFFSWLWTSDRKSWVEVREFLFPTEDGLFIDLGLGTFNLFPEEAIFTKKY